MAKARTSTQRTTAGDGPDTADAVAGQAPAEPTTVTVSGSDAVTVSASENVDLDEITEPASSARAKPKLAAATPVDATSVAKPARSSKSRSRRSRTILGEAAFHNG